MPPSPLSGWPTAARVVSGVLLAAVIVLAVLVATRSGGSNQQATGLTTTTTIQPVTGPGVTYPGSSTTTSLKATTTTTPGSTTTTSAGAKPGATSTTSTTARGGSTTTTSSSSTTTTLAAASKMCRVAPSNARPAAGETIAVYVVSNQPNAPVSITVAYKTGDVTYPQSGQPAKTTDTSGSANFSFTVAQGSRDYPVVVEVNLAGGSDVCETHFTPTS
ncbi:MAG TPA: hypothetical protein VFA11_15235 [Acidimicrobiales bacterium]|nr:hypothetical protein [Acidimicrobiales bacterium]